MIIANEFLRNYGNNIIVPAKEELLEISFRINTEFERYNMHECSVYLNDDLDTIEVDITWGYLEYSHEMADNIVEGLGGTKIGERIYESDGSDTYSSVHLYTFDKTKTENE